MKNFRRWISIVLCLLSLLEILAGCAKAPESDDEVYLTKGEFLSYYVYDNQMSSELFTPEEVNACEDYSVEAQIIAEWEYLTQEQATGGLDKPVTKEIVVTVCANATFDLKTGDPSKIKDADMLADPQLMADAVASGFCELDNGYFDGEEKLSLPEVEAIMDNARAYEASIHYDPSEEITEAGEGLFEQDTENYEPGDIVIDFGDEEEEPTVSGTAFSSEEEAPHAVLLDQPQPRPEPARVVLLDEAKANFSGNFDVETFEVAMKNPSVGDIVEIKRYSSDNQEKDNPIMGKLLSKEQRDGRYYCQFQDPTFEEAVEKKNVVKTGAHGIFSEGFELLKSNVGGWQLSFDLNGDSIAITAEKDVPVYQQTDRKQDWQNAKRTVHAKASYSLSDFRVDAHNLKAFATGWGSGYLKISCDSSFDMDFSGSLRYSPDSNRNGKFPSNFSNSRWTDADSQGASKIKIAKFHPQFYGTVGAEVYIYLEIRIDGSIHFSTEVDDGGVCIKANKGKISMEKLGRKTKECEVKCNVKTRLGVDVTVTLFTRIKIVGYDVGLDVNLDVKANLYVDDKPELEGVYADEDGLTALSSEDSTITYCLDGHFSVDVTGDMSDNGIKILREFGKDKLGFTLHVLEGSIHFEDGDFVKECTRGKKKDDEVKKSETDEVELETYKVNMADGTCQNVRLLAVPAKSKEVMGTKNAVTVKSLNEEICRASYNSISHTIMIETTGGEGSTEIVVMAKKSSVWWKNAVEQKISVTVSKDSDLEVHELTEAGLPEEEPIFVSVFLPVMPSVRA